MDDPGRRGLWGGGGVGLFVFLLAALAGFGGVARAEAPIPRTIRVAMDDNYPPYVFRTDDGQLVGILIDQWRAWEKQTGIRAEIHAMDWGEALRRMRAGEFDVIDTIFETGQRRTFLDFTAPYARIEVPVFFRSNLSGITDLESLKGFPVAAKAGDAAVDLLQAHGVPTVLLFQNYGAIVEAAKEHKINVFVVDAPPAFYFLNKLGIEAEFRHSAPLYVGEFRRAVRKGNTALRRTVEQGFAAIGPERLNRIDEKWFGRPLPGPRYFVYAGYATAAALLLLGALVGWNYSLRRMVERRTAALRENEEKFRAVFDKSPIPILLTTLPGGFVADANPAVTVVLGYEPAELRGKTTVELNIWADPGERARYLEILRARGSVTGFEARARRRNGEVVTVLLNGTVVQIGGGAYTLASLLDISERKRAEEQARRLANFPELNPNPVLEFAADGTLAYSNPAARAMASQPGFPDLPNLLPPDTRAIVAHCLATGEPRLRLETRHGRHTLSWSFYPIAAGGIVHCYVGDITERLQLEERVRQSQKMEAVGQLAGGVAHDFNNMLTVIMGHLDILRTDPRITPDMAESVAEIAAAANRAVNLTRQLLAFSRHQVMTPRNLDLNEVVANLTKMLRRVLGEHIAMQFDPSSEPLTFHGDAGMMEQVMLNLAVNARDAMPNGGTLRMATRREQRSAGPVDEAAGGARAGAFVVLSVSDTGSGIAPDIVPKIFEPFYTTKDVGKGTGLGLATVFGIVQQHRGWIEVDSEVGRGTAFHIYLPRVDAPPTAAPVESAAVPGRGRGETILFVEDEPAVREMGVLALTRQGYRMLAAASGREALGIWSARQPEIALLLTDLIMPDGLSGLELARQLLRENPKLRVIYTSGYSAEIAGKEMRLKDGVNYLSKPYERAELFRMVRAVLDGGASRTPFGTPS